MDVVVLAEIDTGFLGYTDGLLLPQATDWSWVLCAHHHTDGVVVIRRVGPLLYTDNCMILIVVVFSVLCSLVASQHSIPESQIQLLGAPI